MRPCLLYPAAVLVSPNQFWEEVLSAKIEKPQKKTWCTVTVARVSVRHRGMIQHWNPDLGREVVQRKRYRAPQKSGLGKRIELLTQVVFPPIVTCAHAILQKLLLSKPD